jgi:transposase
MTANALNNLGAVMSFRGEYGRAEALYVESLAIRREVGDRCGIADSLANLGTDARRRGELERARAQLSQALTLNQELGDQPGIAGTLEELAAVAALRGDHVQAARLVGATQALRSAAGISFTGLPVERSELERVFSGVRAALGEETFAVARLAGSLLKPEHAVAEALAPAGASETGAPGRPAAAAPAKPVDAVATFAELSDEQWQAVAPLLPLRPRRGRPRADDRRVIDGILYVLTTGCRWVDLPARYGSDTTAWQRLRALRVDGTWERICAVLRRMGRTDFQINSK